MGIGFPSGPKTIRCSTGVATAGVADAAGAAAGAALE
jgi:hypothetical protein